MGNGTSKEGPLPEGLTEELLSPQEQGELVDIGDTRKPPNEDMPKEELRPNTDRDPSTNKEFIVGNNELRWMWIFFSSVWPVTLPLFFRACYHFYSPRWYDCYDHGALILLVAFVAIPLLVFGLVACVLNGNIIHEFRYRDFVPSAAWTVSYALLLYGDGGEWLVAMASFLFLVLALVTTLKQIDLCFDHGSGAAWERLMIQFLGLMTMFQYQLKSASVVRVLAVTEASHF